MYAESGLSSDLSTAHDTPGDHRNGSCAAHNPAVAAAVAQSPALARWTLGTPPAYEMKFLLAEHQAREVEAALRGRLALDPNCDPSLDNAYRVTTVYSDTPAHDVYYRVGQHRRRRFRLRRYGDEQRAYVERKTRHGERVWKRRSIVEQGELPLLSGFSTPADWPGHWFHRQLLRRDLRPVCCVQYVRRALVGADSEGALRLTFDRQVRGAALSDWDLVPAADPLPLLEDRVICEFKFRGKLPAVFKAVIHDLQLAPAGVSKFRHCLNANGLIENGRAGDA